MIHITLKDGVVKDFEAPVTPMQIAKSIGEGLYKAVCVAKIDGVVRDLRTPIEQDAQVELLTFDEDEGKRAFWHTASHVMAQAVCTYSPTSNVPSVLQSRTVSTTILIEKPFTPRGFGEN